MANCKLIVHADDFGLSEKINEGILEAHRNGILTSTSIMSVGTAFDHAIQLSRSTPTLDIGIHLTLIEEEALSNKEDITTLLDNNGRFYGHAVSFMKRYFLGKVSLDEVRRELDAQIQKVLNNSIEISHLDSHQHIHMLPGIRRIVGELAKKYSIPSIRYPKERLKSYMLNEKHSLSRLVQLLALNTFCSVANTSGSKRPDYFFGFFFGGNVSEENLRKVLKNLPANGACELMCHPGDYDADCRYDHWEYRWQDELKALTNQGVKDLLERKGVKLISYADLAT